MAAAELSKTAVGELFEQLGMTPEVTALGELEHHRGDGLDLFVGDMFDLSSDRLGVVDAVYDRAAIVALPPAMRARYAVHLMELTARAPQLVVAYDYDQSLAEGPPFSVPGEELERHYGHAYGVERIGGAGVPSEKRGADARENVWLLSPVDSPNSDSPNSDSPTGD